jgi:hypothetical protein
MTAQSTYYLVIRSPAEISSHDPVGIHHGVEGLDVAPDAIVSHHRHDREPEADEGVEFEAIEAEGSIAQHKANEFLGVNHLRGKGEGCPRPKRSEGAGVEDVSRS